MRGSATPSRLALEAPSEHGGGHGEERDREKGGEHLVRVSVRVPDQVTLTLTLTLTREKGGEHRHSA